MNITSLLPENVVRLSLEFEYWRSMWKCFSLVDFKIEKKWYLGEGKTPQEAIDACNQNMLTGVSLDVFVTPTPSRITKGSIAIDRIRAKREEEKKPISEIF